MQTVMDIKEIELTDIIVSEFNTRKDMAAGTEEAGLNDLASSIKERGLLNPITVRKRSDGRYDLVAGQRRFLACKTLGMGMIPAIIRNDLSDTDATIVSLVENVHRADMSPLDKAKAYQQIYQIYQDYNKVASETGVSVPTIKKYLNLLNLAPPLQEKITTSEGSAGVGALSRLASTYPQDRQQDVYNLIGGFKQSVQVEIMKRSEGDPNRVPDLKNEAVEGAFNTKTCTDGLCFEMSEELKAEIKRRLAVEGSLKEAVIKLI